MEKEQVKKEEANELEVVYKIDKNEIRLTPSIVQNYLVGSSTPITRQEYKFFVELCKVRKLNPFLKEAYLIKFGNQPAQIVVGKDAILKRAILHPEFNGRQQGVIVEKEDGTIEERNGTFKSSKEKLVGGWAKVYRKDWEYPTYVTVEFNEVAQTKSSGELNSNWANKGATMVEKVATVRALRETFVEELGGMIDADEAWTNIPRSNVHEVVEQDEPQDTEKVIDIDEL